MSLRNSLKQAIANHEEKCCTVAPPRECNRATNHIKTATDHTTSCATVTPKASNINASTATQYATTVQQALKKHATNVQHSMTAMQQKIVRNWLTEIGEPEADHFLVLSKCKRDPEALIYYLGLTVEHARIKRREKVLKMLADNPEIMRAFITDAESDQDHVIIALAIRGVGTCELLIPRHKYDPFLLLESFEKESLQ